MDTPIPIDRDKLFEEVWAEPMLNVSKRYGISDVGLAKRVGGCSYQYRREATGAHCCRQKITNPALPPKPAGAPKAVELSPTGPTVAPETAARARRDVVKGTNKILVEEILSKAHPLIAAAKKSQPIISLTNMVAPQREMASWTSESVRL